VVAVGVRRRGRGALPGVVEAVVPARVTGIDAAAEQDRGAAQEAKAGADPAGVQREAERHQALLPVGADGEPDGRHDAAQSWRRERRHFVFVFFNEDHIK